MAYAHQMYFGIGGMDTKQCPLPCGYAASKAFVIIHRITSNKARATERIDDLSSLPNLWDTE